MTQVDCTKKKYFRTNLQMIRTILGMNQLHCQWLAIGSYLDFPVILIRLNLMQQLCEIFNLPTLNFCALHMSCATNKYGDHGRLYDFFFRRCHTRLNHGDPPIQVQ